VASEDESGRDRVEPKGFAKGLRPLANHGLSRRGKDIHAQPIRDYRRDSAAIAVCAAHLPILQRHTN
jgi:hypothetical protein